MSFSIVWDDVALEGLLKFDLFLRRRIVKKIEEFAQSGSFNSVKRIVGGEGLYRLRVGDYRIIFKLERGEILILKIGYRKKIYKK